MLVMMVPGMDTHSSSRETELTTISPGDKRVFLAYFYKLNNFFN